MVARISFAKLMELPADDRVAFIKVYDSVWAQFDTEVQRLPYSSGTQREKTENATSQHNLTVDLDSATAAMDMKTLQSLFPLSEASTNIEELR